MSLIKPVAQKIVTVADNIDASRFNKLYHAQDVIENYAKHYGINVDITKAKDRDVVEVAVQDLLRGKTEKMPVIENENEPFLRTVYRAVQNLTDYIQGRDVDKLKIGKAQFEAMSKEKQLGTLAMTKYRSEHSLPHDSSPAGSYAWHKTMCKDIINKIFNKKRP